MLFYMKKIVFLLITYISLTIFDVKAFEVCDDVVVKHEVNLYTSYGQLVYDYSKNTRQISKIAAQIGHKESSHFAAGLATVVVESEYRVGTRAKPKGLFSFCVVPRVIDVYVGLSMPRIYISNELERNTCLYNLVLLHEQTHQQINKKAMDYFLPHFKKSAQKIANELPALKISYVGDLDAATNEITEMFDQKFNKVVDIFKKELAIEQGKLDSKGNYLLENNICKSFNATHFHR